MNNSPEVNRVKVRLGQATASSGMKKVDLDHTRNRAVFGGDRHPPVWPCKKDHPPHRISEKNGRLYCLECEQEKARYRRELKAQYA